jgi:hypothetical protein
MAYRKKNDDDKFAFTCFFFLQYSSAVQRLVWVAQDT